MSELTVHQGRQVRKLAFRAPAELSELLGEELMPETPCGGNGTCGKCAVYATGAFSPEPDEAGRVLACQAVVTGDGEVYLPSRRSVRQIQADGILEAWAPVPGGRGWGAAVDIGTTTVVVRLADLERGVLAPPLCAENPQRMLSADVIGRIQAAGEGKGPILRRMIAETVDHLLDEACQAAGIGRDDLVRTVITGNTTMLYLYTGRNPEPLSHAPFQADCLFGYEEAGVWYPPCFGAFVGADIYTAIRASGMCRRSETALLIDLGTNGEIALVHEGRLLCCSTAAGPAFEGSSIRCGGVSTEGAVDHVSVENGAITFTTIGGGPAQCICGSGLIDLLACLLAEEIVDETGAMEEGPYRLTDEVALYQEDVRQLQLAKGAIRAGMETLLLRAGLTAGQVDALYVAGGFGTVLDLENAAAIGLIPAELVSRTHVLGNAALTGALLELLGPAGREEPILTNAQCLNLSECKEFTDLFLEAMLFD